MITKKGIFLLIFGLSFSLILILGLFFGLDELLGIDNKSNITERLGLNNTSEDDEFVELEVEILDHKHEVIEGFTVIGLNTNKEITLKSNNRLTLTPQGKNDDGKLEYVIEVTTIPLGESVVNFILLDEYNNEFPQQIKVNRIESFTFLGKQFVEPWPDTLYELDGNNLLAMVSKQRRLLNTYKPIDLINIRENYINIFVNNENFELRGEAAGYLDLMLAALRNETGQNVVIASAFRSYNTQVRVYAGYVLGGSTARAEVDRFSARPGYSEHQLGTVVDFVNEESGFEYTEKFDDTVAGKWLKENSWKYGFIQSYPKGSEDKTGYIYEAWHYRYIGTENATKFKESGMILSEWLKSI